MSKREIWIVVAVSTILALLLATHCVTPQEICDQTKQAGHASQEYCPSYSLPLFVWIKVGQFIENHEPLITALSGAAVAIFTAVLAWSTHLMWQASNRQLKLAREEFNATHRPKILVREMRLQPPTEDKPARVMFIVSNAGETNAVITASAFVVRKFVGGVEQRYTGGVTAELHGLMLEPGEGKRWTESAGMGWTEFRDRNTWYGPTGQPVLTIVFDGKITYEDANGLQRVSAFNRQYDPRSDRFIPGDPEREYAD